MNLERLQSAYWYDAETGVFTRRCAVGRTTGGRHKPNCNGYVMLMVDGERIYAHRAAWLYVYGELPGPDHVIDHANGDRKDNRIANLVLSTRSKNAARGRTAGALAGRDWRFPVVPYVMA